MVTLPDDVLVEILSRLPVKSLLRFKCVNKFSCNSIDNPNFVKTHTDHLLERDPDHNSQYLYLFLLNSSLSSTRKRPRPEEDEIALKLIKHPVDNNRSLNLEEIVGTCNGLVCLKDGDHKLTLWNPSTKEFKRLVQPQTFYFRIPMFGFGYHPCIDKYKVVQMDFEDTRMDPRLRLVDVNVYTLGTYSWRRIGKIPNWLPWNKSEGVLVNGALHWITMDTTRSFCAFDLMDEQFRELEFPDFFDYGSSVNLVNFGGSLCVLNKKKIYQLDAWVMKEYGVDDSWTKLFTISSWIFTGLFKYLRPIRLSDIGDVLYFSYATDDVILLAEYVGCDEEEILPEHKLVCYDWKNDEPRTLKVPGIPKLSSITTLVLVGSLVSLNPDYQEL